MVLKTMSQDEYGQYMRIMVSHYGEEKRKSSQCSAEEAQKMAEAETAELLPQGMNTENHLFYCLVEEERLIGYLWLQVFSKADRMTIYICDFYILEEYRGQGYGKQAMQTLDEEAKRLGASKIALHVFAHNERAVELYKKMGFYFTNHYMAKTIGELP